MASTDEVLKQFALQAEACDQLGSPFTATLCRVLADNLDLSSRFGRTILEWPGDAFADNVALRACGALHALARSNWEPDLARAYPPHPFTPHSLWVAIAESLRHQDSFLTERLHSAPQTNEVARSGAIIGAMLVIADRTRLPLAVYEIGASAGLNLSFDRYRYRLGNNLYWGSPTAALSIENQWRGSPVPPLDAPLTVASRRGCDLKPINAADASDRERLMSYIWADQTVRLQRTEVALALTAREGIRIDLDDAAFWLERQLAEPPQPGTTRVVMHTIVWPYMPRETQTRIADLLDRLGAEATSDTPFAHLSIEPDETPGSARVDLSLWPARETITLARMDFHGRWTEWM